MERATPLLKEDHSSQIPALQVLQNLGWEYLTSEETLAARGGRRCRRPARRVPSSPLLT